jgi:predicted porin
MKFKKLKAALLGIALAASAAPALAVDTQFYGVIREFIDHDNVTGGPTDNKPGIKLTSFISKIGFSAIEPLNDVNPGLVAGFALETSVFADNPTSTSNPDRAAHLGNEKVILGFTQENLWSLNFGRDKQNVWKMLINYGPWEDLYGSPSGEIHNRQGLRMNNGMYATYNPLKDVTLFWDHSFSEVQARGDADVVGAKYEVNNFSTSVAYYNEGYTRAGYTRENESRVYGASYRFDNLRTKLSLLHSDDIYLDKQTHGTTVTVEQPITEKFKVSGGYGYREQDNVKAVFAGADYSLSKRLTLELRAQHVTADNAITFTTANDLVGIVGKTHDQVGVGLEFKF